jgi:hypothetical protein
VTIQNYDDVVAVKPMNGNGIYSQCSENITVRNSHATYGVGWTIGSVPPDAQVNCIRNVTFVDLTSTNPLKAIYVKTNPGDVGTGIIDRITYRNINVLNSIWYPIW